MGETYAEMKARIDRERAMNPVQDLEVIAAQERELRAKWIEEFGTDPPEPVTHLYREEGTSEANDSSLMFPPLSDPAEPPSVEPISQIPVPSKKG